MRRERIHTEKRGNGDRMEIRHTDTHEHREHRIVLVGVGVAHSVRPPLLRSSVLNRCLRNLNLLRSGEAE